MPCLEVNRGDVESSGRRLEWHWCHLGCVSGLGALSKKLMGQGTAVPLSRAPHDIAYAWHRLDGLGTAREAT
jgi:hypothetical protein